MCLHEEYTPTGDSEQVVVRPGSNSQYGPIDQKDRRNRAKNGLILAYLTSFSGESGLNVGFLLHIENC
jgi:hypothetical protein